MKRASGARGAIFPASEMRNRQSLLHRPRLISPDEPESAGDRGERRAVDSEFPKNSINIDKFTGFFDKFLKIFSGLIPATPYRRISRITPFIRCRSLAKCGKTEQMRANSVFLAETPESS